MSRHHAFMITSALIFTHKVNQIIDQQSSKVGKIAAKFDISGASPCGFLALAILFDETLNDKMDILNRLEFEILPWIVKRRNTYVDSHPGEFVPDGTSWRESTGRMNVASYLTAMASAVEISNYIDKHASPDGVNVAFLRKVYEGPPINEASIRMPRSDFTSEEDALYLDEEKPFHGHDYYIQLEDHTLVTVEKFIQRVKATQGEWRMLMDGCGHFFVFRIIIQPNSREILFEELDTLKRPKDTPSPPCVCLLVDRLKEQLSNDRR